MLEKLKGNDTLSAIHAECQENYMVTRESIVDVAKRHGWNLTQLVNALGFTVTEFHAIMDKMESTGFSDESYHFCYEHESDAKFAMKLIQRNHPDAVMEIVNDTTWDVIANTEHPTYILMGILVAIDYKV